MVLYLNPQKIFMVSTCQINLWVYQDCCLDLIDLFETALLV